MIFGVFFLLTPYLEKSFCVSETPSWKKRIKMIGATIDGRPLYTALVVDPGPDPGMDVILIRWKEMAKEFMNHSAEKCLTELRGHFYAVFPEYQQDPVFQMFIVPIHAIIQNENLIRKFRRLQHEHQINKETS
jgi:hypothetical protein